MSGANLAGANDRNGLCRDLLELQASIADELAQIDAHKAALRAMCLKAGEGFSERIEGLGAVQVRTGSEPKLKGILPVLKPEVFLALPTERRNELVKKGLVEMAEQWSKKTSPAVTVELARA